MELAAVVGVVGVVLGVGIGWFLTRQSLLPLQQRLSSAESDVARHAATVEQLNQSRLADAAQIAGVRADLANRDVAIGDLKATIGELESRVRAEQNTAEKKLQEERGRYGQLAETLGAVRGDLNGKVQTLSERSAQLADANDRLKDLTARFEALQKERAELSEQLGRERARAHSSEQSLERQQKWIVEQTEAMRINFSEIAGKIVADKTSTFKKESADTLGALLSPLREQIDAFRHRVDTVHNEDTQGRASLQTILENVGRSQQVLSDQAQNLTLALTTKPKAQGDFGEMKLETQLQDAGFQEGYHYQRQPTFKTEIGANLRPDIVINMPTRTGYLAVDAKVTLTSWINVIAATTKEERAEALTSVAASLRAHIDGLSDKAYPALMSGESPVPYTLMYVPIEGAVQAAMEHDPSLFADAQRKKIIIATPSTLFVMLSIIGDLWRVANQEANAKAIASEGAKLLNKLNGFLESFGMVGKRLDEAFASFQKADGQLHSGRGSAISVAKKMSLLGIQGKNGLKLQQSLARIHADDIEDDQLTLLSAEDDVDEIDKDPRNPEA